MKDTTPTPEPAIQSVPLRLQAALSAGGIGTWTWDLVSGRIVGDAATARLFAISPEAAAGPSEAYFQSIHPEDHSAVAQAVDRAVAHGEAYEVEYRVLLPDGGTRWLVSRGGAERDAAGVAVTLAGVSLDITEQVERRERERFLAALAERARSLTDPEEVIADAVRSVGRFLGVSRCVFVDIDIPADTCTCHPDYRADESVVSMAGVFPISAFGEFVVAAYGAGQAVAVDDVRLDRDQVPEGSVATYDALGIRAHVGIPVVHSSRLVSCIGVHNATPRHWAPEEIELLRAVVERTWLTVEVLRQERALAREAGATARILESITDAFFTVDRQWRYTYINSRVEALWGRERADLLGMTVWEAWPEAVGSAFDRQFRRAMSEGVAVRLEEFFAPLDAWLEVRVFPSTDGLSVFFQDVSARKALEAERERLAERERNIAAQLQEALQPALPDHVPGLQVASFTRPALQEAQVGGDFFDIFPLDKELYALVIGDVSGKGLAAAQQLALVRNSLRTTLYLYRAPAQAAASLNAILTAHDLLVGFVTAFVGVYDAVTGVIAYASCGHEPALVRRADGAVEETVPTGPPLGVDQGAAYGAGRIALAPGDTLLLYTDGLSEAGPSRCELLGTAGLTRLLSSVSEGVDVQAQAEALVAGVGAFAGGVFHDDVAVLLVRRH